MTLYDLGMDVAKIREAINSIEVKGESNASLVVYAVRKCNEVIEAINAVVEKRPEENQNGENQQEEGVVDGEQPNSGTA